MFNDKQIIDICQEFGIICTKISDVIDTSRNNEDRRYNYIINDKYFLKINNSKIVTEKFLKDVDRITKKYREIDVNGPAMIRTRYDMLSHEYTNGCIQYTCYMEELAMYRVYKSDKMHDYKFRNTAVRHLGKLASQYTNTDLLDIKSMLSLIELGSFDTDMDEKQSNIDKLIDLLYLKEYYDVASKVEAFNIEAREKIEKELCVLPRCVYQGDLNDSNILVDDNGKIKEVIDFNMSGTEVNINCFLNETMYYLIEEDFVSLTAKEIFNKMEEIQDEMMLKILEFYRINNIELEVLQEYKKVIFISFYPNVMLWIKLLLDGKMDDKVIELINIILTM